MAVEARQRFALGHPCPVCGGHPGLPQGRGVRCAGYLSGDGRWAHCTRAERAGGIEPTRATPPTYAHRLTGDCRCGARHGPPAGSPNGASRRTEPARYWSVRDVDGSELARHWRRDAPAGKRMWWTDARDAKGLPRGLRPVDLLYGLERLSQRPADEPVILAEGEPATDALTEAGYLALGTVCGAASTPTDAVLRHLAERPVTLWPDADPEGEAHMVRIGAALARLGVEALSWVSWPDAPPKGDAADADIARRQALVAAAAPWTPPAARREPEHPPAGPAADDQAGNNTPRLIFRQVGEVADMPEAEITWVVERFCAEGIVTDLAAYIKSGKSTLAAQLMASVLHGEPFLGLEARQGSVILLTEERQTSLMAAMTGASIESGDPLHICLWHEQPALSWEQIIAQAFERADAVSARLVVVDTLGWWARVESSNDADQARDAMSCLLRAATGRAILALRQARKSGGETHAAGRGSGAYGGAADILLHLDYARDDSGRPAEGSTERVLSIISRLEREAIEPMHLNYRHGRYITPQPIIISQGTRLAIRADLEANRKGSPAAISRRTGIARTTIATTLRRMARRGEVVSDGEGGYGLASDDTADDTPMTPPKNDDKAVVMTLPPPTTWGGGGSVIADTAGDDVITRPDGDGLPAGRAAEAVPAQASASERVPTASRTQSPEPSEACPTCGTACPRVTPNGRWCPACAAAGRPARWRPAADGSGADGRPARLRGVLR